MKTETCTYQTVLSDTDYIKWQSKISGWLHVTNIKYLGHIIDNASSDNSDINREIKALFTRTNVLCRRFSRCSLAVKVRLFRTYCVCFYDTVLWSNFTTGAFNRFLSCYSKCIKCFFSDIQSIVALQIGFERYRYWSIGYWPILAGIGWYWYWPNTFFSNRAQYSPPTMIW